MSYDISVSIQEADALRKALLWTIQMTEETLAVYGSISGHIDDVKEMQQEIQDWKQILEQLGDA